MWFNAVRLGSLSSAEVAGVDKVYQGRYMCLSVSGEASLLGVVASGWQHFYIALGTEHYPKAVQITKSFHCKLFVLGCLLDQLSSAGIALLGTIAVMHGSVSAAKARTSHTYRYFETVQNFLRSLTHIQHNGKQSSMPIPNLLSWQPNLSLAARLAMVPSFVLSGTSTMAGTNKDRTIRRHS